MLLWFRIGPSGLARRNRGHARVHGGAKPLTKPRQLGRSDVRGGVAQVVRACGSYPQCRGFKSLLRYQDKNTKWIYLFWKYFRNVAIPIMPLPTRSIVAGSGTGAGWFVGLPGLILQEILAGGGWGKLPLRISEYGLVMVLLLSRHVSWEIIFNNLLE